MATHANTSPGNTLLEDTKDLWKTKYTESLSNGLEQLFLNEMYTDISIKVGNKTFQCHRVVLAAMSPYFDAMFSSGMKESHDSKITIQCVDSDAFGKILKYIYGGHDVIDTDNIDTLLQASVMLQIKCLQERCEEFMIGKVDVENCIATWKLAAGHGCHFLAQKAFRFVLHYFKDVWQSKDFTVLDVDELLTIIQDNDLNVNNEEIVCDAVFLWIKSDLENRTQYFQTLFEKLRLPLVQPEYLLETIEQISWINENPGCKEVIEEAKRYHLLPARRQDFVSPRLAYRNFGEFEEVIVCIGGSDVDHETTRQVICYSCRSRQWHNLASMPYDPGVEFATCSFGNAIFVSGGSTKMNGMVCFVGTQNKWLKCESMLLGRRRHSMIAVGDSIFALGGYDDNDDDDFRTLMSVEMYGISAGKWEDSGYLKVPVRSAATAVDREKIYLFGGVTNSDCDTKIVQCFDTRHKSCTVLCELPVFCRLSTALSFQKRIIIICPNGDILNFEEGTTTCIGKIPGFNRYSFGAIIKNGSVVVLGGFESSKQYDEFVTFNLTSCTSLLTGEYLPHKAFGFGCVKNVISKRVLC